MRCPRCGWVAGGRGTADADADAPTAATGAAAGASGAAAAPQASAALREPPACTPLLARVACGNCGWRAAAAACDVSGCGGAAVAYFGECAADEEDFPSHAPCNRCGAPTALGWRAREALGVARGRGCGALAAADGGAAMPLEELVALQAALIGQEAYARQAAGDVRELERTLMSPLLASRGAMGASGDYVGGRGRANISDTPAPPLNAFARGRSSSQCERTPAMAACPSIVIPGVTSTSTARGRVDNSGGSGTGSGGKSGNAAPDGVPVVLPGMAPTSEPTTDERDPKRQRTERVLAFSQRPTSQHQPRQPPLQQLNEQEQQQQQQQQPMEEGEREERDQEPAAQAPVQHVRSLAPAEGSPTLAKAVHAPGGRQPGSAPTPARPPVPESSPEAELERRQYAETQLSAHRWKMLLALALPPEPPRPASMPPPAALSSLLVAANAMLASGSNSDGVPAATKEAHEHVKRWYRTREQALALGRTADDARHAHARAQVAAEKWAAARPAERRGAGGAPCAGALLVTECALRQRRAQRELEQMVRAHKGALPAIRAELARAAEAADAEGEPAATIPALAAAATLWRQAYADIVAASV